MGDSIQIDIKELLEIFRKALESPQKVERVYALSKLVDSTTLFHIFSRIIGRRIPRGYPTIILSEKLSDVVLRDALFLIAPDRYTLYLILLLRRIEEANSLERALSLTNDITTLLETFDFFQEEWETIGTWKVNMILRRVIEEAAKKLMEYGGISKLGEFIGKYAHITIRRMINIGIDKDFGSRLNRVHLVYRGGLHERIRIDAGGKNAYKLLRILVDDGSFWIVDWERLLERADLDLRKLLELYIGITGRIARMRKNMIYPYPILIHYGEFIEEIADRIYRIVIDNPSLIKEIEGLDDKRSYVLMIDIIYRAIDEYARHIFLHNNGHAERLLDILRQIHETLVSSDSLRRVFLRRIGYYVLSHYYGIHSREDANLYTSDPTIVYYFYTLLEIFYGLPELFSQYLGYPIARCRIVPQRYIARIDNIVMFSVLLPLIIPSEEVFNNTIHNLSSKLRSLLIGGPINTPNRLFLDMELTESIKIIPRTLFRIIRDGRGCEFLAYIKHYFGLNRNPRPLRIIRDIIHELKSIYERKTPSIRPRRQRQTLALVLSWGTLWGEIEYDLLQDLCGLPSHGKIPQETWRLFQGSDTGYVVPPLSIFLTRTVRKRILGHNTGNISIELKKSKFIASSICELLEFGRIISIREYINMLIRIPPDSRIELYVWILEYLMELANYAGPQKNIKNALTFLLNTLFDREVLRLLMKHVKINDILKYLILYIRNRAIDIKRLRDIIQQLSAIPIRSLVDIEMPADDLLASLIGLTIRHFGSVPSDELTDIILALNTLIQYTASIKNLADKLATLPSDEIGVLIRRLTETIGKKPDLYGILKLLILIADKLGDRELMRLVLGHIDQKMRLNLIADCQSPLALREYLADIGILTKPHILEIINTMVERISGEKHAFPERLRELFEVLASVIRTPRQTTIGDFLRYVG